MDGIDDGNGNEIEFRRLLMTGGNNISNIKEMYNRERRYITALESIREKLKETLGQPLKFTPPIIQGIIDYIGDELDE